MKKITIPYAFSPRSYQIPLLKYMANGGKRACCIWNRRAGKDLTLINLMMIEMMKRVGSYYYFFPEFNQGRRVLWDGMDMEGVPFMSHIPEELRANTNKNEMKIVLKNGSIFQIVGTDNFAQIRGTNPVGCVYSEYSLQNPQAWDVVRPILSQNSGWAVFNYTPLGKNHGYDLYMMAKDNPEWFCQKLTVDDTKSVSREIIEKERREGMEEDLIQQEYYVSFEASQKGAYYSQEMKDMKEQNRICRVPYDPQLLTYTAWDLGVDDATAIIFYQKVGKEIHIVDVEEHNGESIGFFVTLLEQKGYKYGTHYLPHDADARELGTGVSIREQMESLGVYNIEIVPRGDIQDGIQKVRTTLPRVWIDSEKGKWLVECLTQYHKEYDPVRMLFRSKPHHDLHSHCSDAFRYLCCGGESVPKPRRLFPLYSPRSALA